MNLAQLICRAVTLGINVQFFLPSPEDADIATIRCTLSLNSKEGYEIAWPARKIIVNQDWDAILYEVRFAIDKMQRHYKLEALI